MAMALTFSSLPNQMNQEETLSNHTVSELKEICEEKGLKKTGEKMDLIGRILTYQEEERKSTLMLKERKEKSKGFGFFKGNHTTGASSSSNWNPFKSSKKATLPEFDDVDTAAAIQASIEDQQKKIPLMKKISQTFNTLKHKASKRFSVNSAAQAGSSITPAGSSKKPSIDVVLVSYELDGLDVAEDPKSNIPVDQVPMPAVQPTSTTLPTSYTADQSRKGKMILIGFALPLLLKNNKNIWTGFSPILIMDSGLVPS